MPPRPERLQTTKTGRPQHAVSKELLRDKARLIRPQTLRMTDICGSGHYGSSFSMAEIVAALYYRFMHLRAGEPQWPDRDRFTMGKGQAGDSLSSEVTGSEIDINAGSHIH
jgi:transketolase N-terminal domain/subunit